MFGAKYSRTNYWVWSIVLFILNIFATIISKAPVGDIENTSGFQILFVVVLLSFPYILWINTLANRIRDYGSNPWLALWALLPIANIVLGFYYGIVQYKKNPSINNNSSNSSLTNAVLNHAKEVASEVKPMVEKYKHSHTTVDNANEDEIYEKIMLEIEEDKKIKSAWARALEKADGNKDKAESLYIKFRAQAIKIELEANLQLSPTITINQKEHKNESKEIVEKIYNDEEMQTAIEKIFEEVYGDIEKKTVTLKEAHANEAFTDGEMEERIKEIDEILRQSEK